MIEEKNKLLEIRIDRVFKDMFNETQMDTLEWTVMQILNAKYEDVHGKVKVQNASLTNSYKEERNKTVDLLVDYNGDDILIELNNNYSGNYMRNLLYAFNVILRHYNKGVSAKDIIKNRVKVILVNLNWYPENSNYRKVLHKVEHVMPYPEDNTNDFIIKTLNINMDLYKDFCYDDINEWDKLWKLLTIEDEEELKKFIENEKLLKQYHKKLLYLSSDEEYKMGLLNEAIERNAMFEQTYGIGYRRGVEEGINSNQREIVINMYNENISLEMISKCTKLSILEIKNIIETANENY